jgi:hypothetical protein
LPQANDEPRLQRENRHNWQRVDLAIAAGCFPEAWCGTLAGSVSAKGAVSFKPGAAPQDFDSDEQALKARVNSIA